MPEKLFANSAYYCCGARFKDAERKNPVCGDNYVKVFMNKTEKEVFKKFDKKN